MNKKGQGLILLGVLCIISIIMMVIYSHEFKQELHKACQEEGYEKMTYLNSFSEAECYDLCDGGYFFDSGFFGSDNCVCKEQGRVM